MKHKMVVVIALLLLASFAIAQQPQTQADIRIENDKLAVSNAKLDAKIAELEAQHKRYLKLQQEQREQDHLRKELDRTNQAAQQRRDAVDAEAKAKYQKSIPPCPTNTKWVATGFGGYCQ